MNDLTIFENPEFGRLRGLKISGEPWFVGKDVAVAPAVDRYIYRRRWEEVHQREAEAAAARAAEQRKEAHRREVMDFLLNEAA